MITEPSLGVRVHALTPRRAHVVLAILIAAALALAWHNRFIQDDAFITFRYALNMLDGLGPVWNPGERIEGYTNFLWMVLVSAGMALGVDAVKVSCALGLLSFCATLATTYRLALSVLPKRGAALIAVLLVASNYTASAYATSGLETSLFTFLMTASFAVLCRIEEAGLDWSRTALLSIILACALLTRMDAGIAVMTIGAAVLAINARAPGVRRWNGAALVAGAAPFLLIVLTWLGWKWSFYGALLPNTFYLKAAGVERLADGFDYLRDFVTCYWLLPFLLLALIGAPKWVSERPMTVAAAFATLAIWSAYVVKIGGDFMEFRFLVPMLPILFIAITGGIFAMAPWWRGVAVTALLIGSFIHAERSVPLPSGLQTIRQMHARVVDDEHGWIRIGQALHELFPDGQVRIAVGAVGAIGFYSHLEVVDQLGVNDGFVAREGRIVPGPPGHVRRAPLSYLLQRKVNLIISATGSPVPIETGAIPDTHTIGRRFLLSPEEVCALPAATMLIQIPIGNWSVQALYLRPHPEIDRDLRERGWLRASLPPRCPIAVDPALYWTRG